MACPQDDLLSALYIPLHFSLVPAHTSQGQLLLLTEALATIHPLSWLFGHPLEVVPNNDI